MWPGSILIEKLAIDSRVLSPDPTARDPGAPRAAPVGIVLSRSDVRCFAGGGTFVFQLQHKLFDAASLPAQVLVY